MKRWYSKKAKQRDKEKQDETSSTICRCRIKFGNSTYG